MIQHMVFLSLLPDADRAELDQVMAGLVGLIGQIDGFQAFSHGPNLDFEGKSQEAPYGFICTFDSAAAVERYANDPGHKALGGRLVALCGGADRIKVYDLKVGG